MGTPARENHGAAGRAAAICLAVIILSAVPMCGAFAAQYAAANPAPASGDKTLPPKAHELLTLLAEEWLEEQGVTKSAAPPAQSTDKSFEDYANSGAGAIHEQIVALARAIPDLPNEFERAAARITAFDPDSGRAQFLLKLGIFGDRYKVATRLLAARVQLFLKLAIVAAFGFGAQWLFRKMTGRVRRRLDGFPMDTVKDRLRVIATRVALAFGVIGVFVLGSLGPLLTFDWDPVRRGIILGFLIVFVAIQVAATTGELLLAPSDERFRIIPTDTVAARFWCRRLTVFAGWFAFVWVIVQECSALDFSYEELQLVGYTLGLGLVAIALESVWRRPVAPRAVAAAPSAEAHHFGRGAANTALSIGIVLLWVFWVAAPGVMSVLPGFWLVLVIIVLPPAILREARGRASAQTPRFIPDWRSAERHRSNSRTRYPGPLDHWRGGGARLGLGCRPRAPRRPGHIVRPHHPRRANHRCHPVDRRCALACCEGHDRQQARPHRRSRSTKQRRGAAAGAAAHLAADFPQRFVCPRHCCRGNDGAGGIRGRDWAADRWRERGRRRDRLWRADFCSRRHRRHVLPARRRLPGRRVHPERQLQGHGRRLQHSFG